MNEMKLFLMPKPRKRRGFSLIEVTIVLAISALLLVGALSIIQNGDRRNFDNSMQTVVAQVREIQNEANEGIGPDPKLFNCLRLDASYNNCPFKPYSVSGVSHSTYLLGRAISFGHAANDTSFGSDTVVGGQTLTTKYFTWTLGYQPLLAQGIFPIESVAAPVTHSLPPGVGFVSFCLGDGGCSGTTAPAGVTGLTDSVTSVFGRANLSAIDVTGLPDNALPLNTAVTRNFPACSRVSVISNCPVYTAGSLANAASCVNTVPNPTYFETYSNSICGGADMMSQYQLILHFSDLKTGTYNAEIIIDPISNSVSLLTQ